MPIVWKAFSADLIFAGVGETAEEKPVFNDSQFFGKRVLHQATLKPIPAGAI